MLTPLLRHLRGLPLLLLVLVFFSVRPVLASHLIGGELSYRYLGATGAPGTPFRYEVTALIYVNSDQSGTPQTNPNWSNVPTGRLSIDIAFYQKNGAFIQTVTIPRQSFRSATPALPASCPTTFTPPPVNLAKYVATVDLPVSFNGYYAYYADFTRTAGITNLQQPSDTFTMSLYMDMAPPLIPNSSPTFSDTAVALICLGDTTVIINNANDADGDRLTYSFGTPYSGNPTPPPFFTPPPPPIVYNNIIGASAARPFGSAAGNFASLNANTGLSKYVAMSQGKYVVAVDVSEYRTINGQQVLVGLTRRDVLLVTRVCPPGAPPVLPPTTGTNGVPRSYSVEIGQPVNFPIRATGNPSNSAIQMKVNSVLLDGAGGFNATYNNNPGTVAAGQSTGIVTVNGPTGSVNANFQFTPRCADARATPYDVLVTVTDQGCSRKSVSDIFQITVTPPVGPNAITGPTVVCDPANVRTYTAAGPVPASYNWQITGGTILSGQGTNSVQVRWNSTPTTGTLTLNGVSNFGCSSAPVSVNVDIRPLAALSVTPLAPSICRGASTTLAVSGPAGLTYTWTGGTQPLTGSSITVSPQSTTTYTVTGSDGTCTTTQQVTVSVTPPPTADAGPARSFCSGGSAQLGTPAVAGATYSWSPATGLSSATVAQPTVTLTNTTGAPISTTYTLTVTTANGCVSIGTVQVTVTPGATADAGPARSFCSGGSAQLGTPAVAGATYSWSPATGLSSATVAQPTVTLTNTTGSATNTTYTVTATTASGCTATSTVVVTVNPAAVANPGPAVSFCSGGSAQLGVAPVAGTTYSWSPATGLSDPTVANPTVTGTNTTGGPSGTTYTLTATTANGCVATATVSVTINPAAVVNAGPAVTTCSGVAAQLGAAPVAGTTYSWSPATGLSSATAANPTVTLTNITGAPTTATYTLTATTANGCVATATVVVTIAPAAIANPGPAVSFCSGGSTQIGAAPVAGTTYSWNPATGLSDPTVANPTVTGTNTTGAPISTTYTLTTNNASGCTATATVVVTINPAAVANAGPDRAQCVGFTGSIGMAPVAGTTYSWSPATGLSNPTAANPTLSVANTTSLTQVLTYTLTATTAQGCTATDAMQLTLYPAAVANPGPAVSFCSGGSAQLGVAPVAGTTYSWSPATGLSDPTVANPTVTGTNTTGAPISTSYTLTVTTVNPGGNNCASTATVSVTINPAAVANAGPAVTSCSGVAAQLGVAPVAGTTYSWSPATGLSSATVANPTVTLTNITGAPTTTTYTLTATTAQGCTATSTVAVTVNPAAVATAGPAVSFCSSGSAQLGVAAVAGTTYSWSPATGLSSATVANPTVTLTNTTGAPITTTYTLTATTANGCTATSTVAVTVNQAAVATAGPARTICAGLTAQLGTAPVAGTTYAWTPAAGLSDPTIANPVVTGINTTGAPITTTYTLTATTAQGCTATSTAAVTVNPAAVADAGPAVTFCSGATAQLGTGTPVAGTTYAWTPATGLSNAAALTPTVTLTNTTGAPITTTYTLTATTAQGCTATSTVAVTVNQVAVATAGTAQTFCSGASAQLGVAAVAGTTYSWSPATGLSDATASNPTVTLTNTTGAPITTTYTLTATTAQGCTATSTVAVTVNQVAVADAGMAQTFCSGGSAQLGSGTPVVGTTYAWTPTTGLSNPASLTPTVTLTNTSGAPITTTYTLTATTAQGCTATSTVAVTVNQVAVANAGPAVSFCASSSGQLGVAPIAGTTYSWTPTAGLSNPTVANPTIVLPNTTTAPITTTYTLTATTAQGCTATSTVAVTVNQEDIANTGMPGNTCSGGTVQLGAAPIPGNTYSWSPATDLSDPNIANPTATLTNTTGGNMTVIYILTATTPQGCVTTRGIRIEVFPAAVATASPGAPVAICSGGTAQLGVAPIAGTTYSWSPATGLSDATVSNPTVTLTNTTTAPLTTTYTLTATTANGCTATSTVTVTVNPATIADAGTNRTVCADESTTLGSPAQPGYTYAWTPAAGLSSATAAEPVLNTTGLNATTAPLTLKYYLTATTGQGCAVRDSVEVTINPRPAAATFTGSASVCPTVTGVTYSVTNPAGTAYQWIVTGGDIASGQGTATITVDWGQAGTGSVRLFQQNSFGCSSDITTLPVTINQVLQTPTPDGPGNVLAAAPNNSVCQAGGPYQYASAPYTNGSLYSWTIIGGTQGSTNLNTVTVNWNPVTVPTIGKIVVTETSNPASGIRCLGTSDTLRVLINPTPLGSLALTGPARVCQSGSVTFTLPGGFAGSTYAFQLNGAPVTGSGNAVTLASQNTPGSYTLTAQETSAQGCVGPVYTTSFTVDPTPAPVVIIGSRFVCDISQPLQYSVAGNPGSTYTWNVTGGTVTAGQNSSQVTVTLNPGLTSYQVSVRENSPFGCAGPVATLTVLPDNPSVTLAVASVDVTSNNRVILTFASPGSTNTPNQIRVLRRDAGVGSFVFVGSVAASATTYTDNTVDATAKSYEYQLELVNGCGRTLQSVVTQTMRLQTTATAGTGGRNQGNVALNWNAYVGFPVQQYQIFRRDDNGTAVLVSTVSGSTLTANLPNPGTGFNQCYRIVAVGAANQASNSNQACVDFANPVAFYNVITPNNDGRNDVLEIDNIKLYPGNSLTIFNRWGREVYNTANYQNNWGGGDNAAGVYYYLLKMPNGTSSKGWFEIIK